MRLSKTTSDHFFKISISSDMFDELDDDAEIPVDSIEALILELELIAAELRKFLEESGREPKVAN